MTKTFVKELEGGKAFDTFFYVSQARVRKAKNKSLYIQATLSDKTGRIEGRMWDAADEVLKRDFVVGTVVRVWGHVDVYKNILSLTIEGAELADSSLYDMSDMVQSSDFDLEGLAAEFMDYIDEIDNRHLKELLQAVFGNGRLWKKFQNQPGAVNVHHAFRGGLLEHSCMMARASVALAEANPRLDKSLLLTGAMLHDLGKIWCYTDYLEREHTAPGNLLGHIFVGANYVDQVIKSLPGFPTELRMLVLHMILSHHGQPEWGSPVSPMIPEAMALHHVDMVDSKAETYDRAVRDDPNPMTDFTERHYSLKVPVYKGGRDGK